jgi:2-polyprenyl-3-methyl-5-hydroxy-6-metoxy-1,4-benzoquinol methylase
VDSNPKVVEYARAVYSTPRTTFLYEDVLKLGQLLAPDFFDTIVSFETVEHVDDPGGLLSVFHSLLRPEGYLVMSAPHGSTSKFHVPRPGQPHGNYTREQLYGLVAQVFPEEGIEYWCQDERTNFYREEQVGCPIRTHIVVARK